jgi:lipoprotein-releasing system permease protein
MDANRSLFSALRMEKYVYAIVLLLIVLIAAFNIIAMLIMVVMEKRKDIAILKSMGATNSSVARIFHSKGMIIGAIGTVVGDLIALALCPLIQHVPLPSGVFYVDTLPIRLHPAYFAGVSLAALLVCFLATIYPARHAARLLPVDVIRYD